MKKDTIHGAVAFIRKTSLGSTLDSLLKEEGILKEVHEGVRKMIKREQRVKYKPGDKSVAYCQSCTGLVNSTFRRAPYIVMNTNISIPRVLQAFCNVCGYPVTLPHQEILKVSAHLKRYRKV